MPAVGLLTRRARRMRAAHFLDRIRADEKVLEIGCGSGWVKEYLRERGHHRHVGLDLHAPADIVGDIRNWRGLGLREAAYDVIIAFEVVEHVDCLDDCHRLLKPGGRLMITTPIPSKDWLLRIMEGIGLNQRRTSPHSHLTDLRAVPGYRDMDIRIIAGLSQWAILTK